MKNKRLYFHFFIANKEVQLTVAGADGKVLEQAASPLNFEDNLFSALNVLHRLMSAGGGKSGFQPDREFIRKIGRIQASLLNLSAPDPAKPVAVQQLFGKHWQALAGDPQASACFSFDFAQQAPYTELAELPWEFLSYQNIDLATGNNPVCDFIRKIQTPVPPILPVAVKKGETLNVLLLLSEPDAEALRRSDKRLVPFRESYLYRLLRVYENLVNAAETPVHLRVLYQPRPAEVQQAQVQRKAVAFAEFLSRFQKNMVEPDTETIRSADSPDFRPHIVHFLGHVSTDERDEEIVGCINDENGLNFMPFQAFTACFAAVPPGLFILQAPEGVQLHRGPFTQSGLLADLAAKRLPYLLTFQHPVSEQGSLAFLRELYSQLMDTQTVPEAVSMARAKLSRDLANFVDANAFGSPTLYATLPWPGTLHYPVLTDAPAGAGPLASVPGSVTDQKTEELPQKIERYIAEIRGLVVKSDYEAALLKFKEIAEIAARSSGYDTKLAARYNNDAIILLSQYNEMEQSYKRKAIDEAKRKDSRTRIGYQLLELIDAGEFPKVANRPLEPGKAVTVAAAPKYDTTDNIEIPK